MISNSDAGFASFIEIQELPIVEGRKVVPSAIIKKNPCAFRMRS
jgi:hypothetical protein